MSVIRIRIEGIESFGDNDDERGEEVAKILRNLAQEFTTYGFKYGIFNGTHLHDSRDNIVGDVEVWK